MKRTGIVIIGSLVVLALVFPLIGCGSSGNSLKGKEATLTDDLGREVDISSVPERIVSISPACTEIIFALGLEDKVVGVTEYCDYPEEAKSKPKIGTFSTPNVEVIVNAEPDLVLATGGVQQEVLTKMEDLGLTVYAVDPKTLDQTVKSIEKVGSITGTEKKASEVAKDMEERAAEINQQVDERESSGEAKPKVFYEIYYENNAWTAGKDSIISNLISLAGGNNVGDVDSSDYYEFSLERIIQENPDVYLISSGSMSNPGDVTQRPSWDQIKAVRDGKVFMIEEDIVYRTGPRLIDGLESIFEALNQ